MHTYVKTKMMTAIDSYMEIKFTSALKLQCQQVFVITGNLICMPDFNIASIPKRQLCKPFLFCRKRILLTGLIVAELP